MLREVGRSEHGQMYTIVPNDVLRRLKRPEEEYACACSEPLERERHNHSRIVTLAISRSGLVFMKPGVAVFTVVVRSQAVAELMSLTVVVEAVLFYGGIAEVWVTIENPTVKDERAKHKLAPGRVIVRKFHSG